MRRLKMKKPEVKNLLGLYLQDRIWQTPSRQLKSGLQEWNMENGFFKGKFFLCNFGNLLFLLLLPR